MLVFLLNGYPVTLGPYSASGTCEAALKVVDVYHGNNGRSRPLALCVPAPDKSDTETR